jgi:hypothetical protein
MLGLFKALGGSDEPPRPRPGTWDLAFHGDLVVELDEELHFNRYRAQTLCSSLAQNLPWRADYLRYCRDEEPACISAGSWGKRWTNDSCVRMFGPAGRPGDLPGAGAPRWKQRAFYDAIKDTVVLTSCALRLSRVAVYDVVDGQQLGTVLEGATVDASAVRALVESRIA